MGKWWLHASTFIIEQISVKLAGSQDRRNISDEFEFWPDQTIHFGVNSRSLLKKVIYYIVQGIVLYFLSDLYETCR